MTMSTLPSNLVAVRAAVTLMMMSSDHTITLYVTDEVDIVLAIVGDVSNVMHVDLLILCLAFTDKATCEYMLGYWEHFYHQGANNVIYVQRERRSVRDTNSVSVELRQLGTFEGAVPLACSKSEE